MVTLNFPDSPTLNQTYTFQGKTWRWNGTAWQAVNGSVGYTGSKGESTFTLGPTPPLNPIVGDRWYNTTDGVLLVYVYDGVNYFWVEDAGSVVGYTGSQGVTGPQGPQGLSGPTGAGSAVSGPQGPIGYTGSTGYIGSASIVSGPQGPSGYNGSLGYTGSQGTPGTSVKIVGSVATVGNLNPSYGGAVGDAYIVEADGDLYSWTGSAWVSVGQIVGPQGPIGYTGSKGDPSTVSGPQGPSGPTGAGSTTSGPQGPSGPTGAGSTTSGPQGPSGPTGAGSTTSGPTGPSGNPSTTSGPQGPSGPTGAASTTSGPTGPGGNPSTVSGPQGPIGYVGSQGISGPQGPSGPTGAIGPQGPIGYTGSQGVSGPQGPVGYTGSQGVSGPTGAASTVSGPQGPASTVSGPTGAASTTSGPQGPSGPTGPNYSTSANVQLGYLGIGVANPGSTLGTIVASDDITAFYSSDSRLKENIETISNALNMVSQIRGVRYDWNNTAKEMYPEKTSRDMGVIAQELEIVAPELVTTRDTGYKAVKYEKIVAILIEAVKELKQEIDRMKKE